MREAAHELQTPGDRGVLHGLALDILEQVLAGQEGELDRAARGLAFHARMAALAPGADAVALQRRELDHLWRASRHFRRTYEAEALQEVLRQCAQSPAATSQESCRALVELGIALRLLGRLQESAAILAEALAAAEQGGFQEQQGAAVMGLAAIAQIQGRMDDAEKLMLQARALCEETGNQQGARIMAGNLAGLYYSTGRMAEAETMYLQCLAQADAASPQAAVLRGNFGMMLSDMGRLAEAESVLASVVADHRAAGRLREQAESMVNLGSLYSETARFTEAEALMRQSLDIYRQIGNRTGEAQALSALGGLFSRQDQWQRPSSSCSRASPCTRRPAAPAPKPRRGPTWPRCT